MSLAMFVAEETHLSVKIGYKNDKIMMLFRIDQDLPMLSFLDIMGNITVFLINSQIITKFDSVDVVFNFISGMRDFSIFMIRFAFLIWSNVVLLQALSNFQSITAWFLI